MLNIKTIALCTCLASLSGCGGLNTQQQYTLGGAAVGAGAGALIGAAGGSTHGAGTGAAIGAAAGAIGGALIAPDD